MERMALLIRLLFLFAFHNNVRSANLGLPVNKDDLFCLQKDKLLYNGSCYPPLTSKPCPNPQTSWLVLSKDAASGQLSTTCSPRLDIEPSIQSCSHPRFDVFGAFSCDCKGTKSQFVLHQAGSPSCRGSGRNSSPPPCPIELRDALRNTCGRRIDDDYCCITELIGSCEEFKGNHKTCSDGAELSSFYFNLTGSYFHDYHDFYEKEGGFGDYFSSGSGKESPEDFFNNLHSSFLNDSHAAPEGVVPFAPAEDKGEGFKVCPDGTSYPSDCPEPVCCPENEIGMEIEMDFCEKGGYTWNKEFRECLPKLFMGKQERLLDYVTAPDLSQ